MRYASGQRSEFSLQNPPYKHHPQAFSVSTHCTQLKAAEQLCTLRALGLVASTTLKSLPTKLMFRTSVTEFKEVKVFVMSQ
jgi:hypothetical protein